MVNGALIQQHECLNDLDVEGGSQELKPKRPRGVKTAVSITCKIRSRRVPDWLEVLSLQTSGETMQRQSALRPMRQVRLRRLRRCGVKEKKEAS